jgi:hypothetical protein
VGGFQQQVPGDHRPGVGACDGATKELRHFAPVNAATGPRGCPSDTQRVAKQHDLQQRKAFAAAARPGLYSIFGDLCSVQVANP